MDRRKIAQELKDAMAAYVKVAANPRRKPGELAGARVRLWEAEKRAELIIHPDLDVATVPRHPNDIDGPVGSRVYPYDSIIFGELASNLLLETRSCLLRLCSQSQR